MKKLSIIIPTLDSHKIVIRQIKRYYLLINDSIKPDVNVIIVDDGSRPPLVEYLKGAGIEFIKEPEKFKGLDVYKYDLFTIIETKNYTKWTQGIACNIGVEYSDSDYIVGFAIDHYFDEGSLSEALNFDGVCLRFKRKSAYIDEEGNIDIQGVVRTAFDIYCMKRSAYLDVGGYDQNLGGRYGGIDLNFKRRFNRKYKQESMSSSYVYRYPVYDSELFHKLERIVEG